MSGFDFQTAAGRQGWRDRICQIAEPTTSQADFASRVNAD
jgi:hypothetical protein